MPKHCEARKLTMKMLLRSFVLSFYFLCFSQNSYANNQTVSCSENYMLGKELTNVIGWVATVSSSIVLLPGIVDLISNKEKKDQGFCNLSFAILALVGGATWSIYSISVYDIKLLVSSVVYTVFAVFFTAITCMRLKRKESTLLKSLNSSTT